MRRPTRSRFIHRVDVIRRGLDQDRTGSLAAAGRVTQGAVPCLVFDKPGKRMPGFGTEIQVKKVRVFFPDPIVLDQGDSLRFVDARGRPRRLVVDSFRDDTNQGLVFVAECQEEPETTGGA